MERQSNCIFLMCTCIIRSRNGEWLRLTRCEEEVGGAWKYKMLVCRRGRVGKPARLSHTESRRTPASSRVRDITIRVSSYSALFTESPLIIFTTCKSWAWFLRNIRVVCSMYVIFHCRIDGAQIVLANKCILMSSQCLKYRYRTEMKRYLLWMGWN